MSKLTKSGSECPFCRSGQAIQFLQNEKRRCAACGASAEKATTFSWFWESRTVQEKRGWFDFLKAA